MPPNCGQKMTKFITFRDSSARVWAGTGWFRSDEGGALERFT